MVIVRLSAVRTQVRPWLPVLVPLGLWATLWLSISPGNPANVLSPHGIFSFIQGFRAILPFIAIGVATALIIANAQLGRPRGFAIFSPLTLAAVYGLAGIIASVKSPDGTMSLRWAGLYLSVPVVLWAAVWGQDSLDRLGRLINSTWLVMILATALLFVAALLYLDLGERILHPSSFL